MNMVFYLYEVRTKVSLRYHQSVKAPKKNLVPNSQKLNSKAIKLKKRTSMIQQRKVLLIFVKTLF